MYNVELTAEELVALHNLLFNDKLSISAPGAKLLVALQDKVKKTVETIPSKNGSHA